MSDQYIRRVLRYCLVSSRWLVSAAVGFALIYLSGTFVINRLLPRTYVGASLVQLQTMQGEESGASTPADSALLQGQAAAAQSDDILRGVIDQLDLRHTWARNDAAAKDGEISSDDALSRLRTQVHVRFITGTNILDLSAASSSSQEAADIANALADTYKSRIQTSTVGKASGLSNVLILTRAAPPQIPARPNIPFDTTVVFIVALFFGASLASFAEILLLFRRAGARNGN